MDDDRVNKEDYLKRHGGSIKRDSGSLKMQCKPVETWNCKNGDGLNQ